MDEYSPKLIMVKRQGVYDLEQVEVYMVPGTENVWAVYQNIDRPKRWVGLHVPTGLAAYNDFASREEAEDVLCWIWCNSVDQKGLHSSEGQDVTNAVGARVLSRFRKGGPLKQPRRKRIQKIGQTVVEVSDAAAHYARRLRELGAEREGWLKQAYSERALLAEQDRLATLREQAVTKLEKSSNHEAEETRATTMAFVADQRKQIADAKAAITTWQNEHEHDKAEFYDQRIELEQLRTAMFHALQAVDIGAVLADGEPSIGRHLRNIRIKGVISSELG